MTQIFTDSVEIQGDANEEQLVVKGHSTQTEALQSWQTSAGTGLAEVTADGRLRVGGDLSVSAPSGLVEVNRDDLSASSAIKQGWQSLGKFAGALVEVLLAWIVHELQLTGTGGVSGVYATLRSRLLHSNTGNSSGADLRAGDFQADNAAGSSLTPVGKLTGVHGAANNTNSGAYLDKAIGVEATITNATGAVISEAAAFEVAPPANDGTIETVYGLRIPDLDEGSVADYAIYTGKGHVRLGDILELVEQSTAPGTPPTGEMYVYPLADGRLYAKNDAAEVFDLAAGTDVSALYCAWRGI